MSALWKRTLALPALFLILLVVIVAVIAFGETPTQSETMGMSGAGLPETEIIRLANDALVLEYSGKPEQVTVRKSTVGALDKFHCGKVGAMISVIVSPLQGEPDICAADSTVWVVTLRGTFRRADFTTESVQVILDRTGRMMAMDSGELVANADAGY